MIRKAVPDDLSAVKALMLRLWPHHTPDALQQELLPLLQQPDSAVFLAYQDACVVGFAQCQLRQDYVEGTDSSPVGYLEGIYVVPEYRRRGFAGQLISTCERWAKAAGCSEFASDCELCNEESFRFHLGVGFQESNRIICFAKKL